MAVVAQHGWIARGVLIFTSVASFSQFMRARAARFGNVPGISLLEGNKDGDYPGPRHCACSQRESLISLKDERTPKYGRHRWVPGAGT
jgi:hypothetical protein